MTHRSDAPSTPPASSWLARFPNRWALFPIVLLGILVTIQGILFSLSRSDPSFAVEPEYYQKAVAWDDEMAQRSVNATLGWKSSAQIIAQGRDANLYLTLQEPNGSPLTGASVQATVFPNARALQRENVQPRETEPGVYTAAIPFLHQGVWEVRLTASRAKETYTQTLRISPTSTSQPNISPTRVQ
jgi:nitrogen fixation protein FixH